MRKKIVIVGIIGLALLAGLFFWWKSGYLPANPHKPWVAGESDASVYAGYAGSQSCRDCHAEAYNFWKNSHHAQAERKMDPALDRAAFDPPRSLKHGTQLSEMRVDNYQYVVSTMSTNGERKSFYAERVVGIDPLRQYSVKGPGGRFQVTEIASDPKKGDWFDVFGEENRVTGEWGHWTGRGMTWNFMCASCHNTRLRKNYEENSDSYKTAMAEMGVGCEACHGGMADHVAWRRKYKQKQGKSDPTIVKFSKDQYKDLCGTCHARRADLTGDFRPGEAFADHYALTIPDETDLFYPDGQIRDEDYEFTPFVGSRMHAGGVRCVNCHEPHSSKVRGQGNVLCMTCHIANSPMTNSPIIDPLAHGHHLLDKAGSLCTDCHMPQTPYMQRHWRHDHGFTIPDPLLTKQYGIPNACNRCHKDKDVAWALEAVKKWYGNRMERPSRTRAQVVAQARAGQHAAVPGLLKLLDEEKRFPLWRAVAANMLKRWVQEPEITKRLLEQTGDTDPLVRAVALRALEPMVVAPPVREALERLANDPVRIVRIDAAWALHATLDTNSLAGKDLLAYLRQNIDQPSGALQMGVFLLDRGDTEPAIAYFRKAVSWDTNSAPLHHALAVGLSLQGKADEAIRSLETACRLAPRDAEYRFKLGLAYNEANRLKAAILALKEAVKLDSEYPQAWYNLGLAYSSSGQLEDAASALNKAESIDPTSPRIPYARATVLARMGNVAQAKAAAQRALELEPNFREAAMLLQVLSVQPEK